MASQRPATAPAAAVPTMPPPIANPPLIPLMDPNRNSGERNSRFIEPPMQEYTPAHSMYDEDMAEQVDATNTRNFLRGLNALMHMGVCVLLLAIMAQFLALYSGWTRYMRSQAIALTVVLCLDILLNFHTLFRVHHDKPGWALLLRLVFGVGYLSMFMVYVGLGRVFPWGYTYWGLGAGFAGPVVYLFLWLLGVWNLLNTALHRHQFGHDMRTYSARAGTMRQRRQARGEAPGPGRGRGTERTTSRRLWTRRRRGLEADPVRDVETVPPLAQPAIPLAPRSGADRKSESATPTTGSFSAKSDYAGGEATRPPATATVEART